MVIPILIAVVVSLGCGAVEFVPSPFTPQNVDLVYSSQEDISIVRWRVSSTAPGSDLKFQILGDSGYQDIDFSQSVYPGGASLCTNGSGTCYQYVVRGKYPVDVWKFPIQGVHAAYGVLPGPRATPSTVATTLSLSPRPVFQPNDASVYVPITDLVALSGPYAYPRQYVRAMWPTNGLCVGPSSPSGVTFTMLDPSGSFAPDLPLTAAGIYCVGIQPVPSDGGDAALAQGRAVTVPIVTDMKQTFVPPSEESPIIYLIILDLQIPNPDRCPLAVASIPKTVAQAMGMAHTTMLQPPPLTMLNLAVDPNATDASGQCTQQDMPTLDAATLAQTVFQTISQYSQTYQQFHLFFFSNLASPLPASLNTSLNNLFTDLASPPAPYNLDVKSWLFNPGAATVATPGAPKPNWWMVQTWQAADDPALAQTLDSYAQQNLPYMSQPFDPSVPVPLLSAADAVTNNGNQIKICDSTLPVRPANTNPGMPVPGPAWPVVGANPPGYFVSFPVNNRIPYGQFVPNSVALDFQICSAYCSGGHPFTSTAGMPVSDDWSKSNLCAVTP